MKLFRVIVPVGDIDAATAFYSSLLGGPQGERVTGGRHYFDCEGIVLALWDPLADGDPEPVPANQQVRQRAIDGGAVPDPARGKSMCAPWRERSFYAQDPWGNPICLVEQGTEYRGGEFTFP